MKLKFNKIVKIETSEVKPIYHLTVKKNHNFFGNNLCLHNCGYRGQLMSVFYRYDEKYYQVGERGAQLLIIPYPKVNFIVKDELSETERNTGGYGHSGK